MRKIIKKGGKKMKKLALLILVVVLLLGLTGCGVITPTIDEEKVESVIYEYFLALSNQDWDKAKSCCVSGSVMYDGTLQIQTALEEFGMIWNWIIDITSTSINGNYAEVYFDATVTAVIEGTESETPKDDITFYLQKVGNDWKIYDSENMEYVESDTYDVDANGIPQFVGVDYIELDKIYQISRFRSGIGHDYSDDFESCRSMKHYFQPNGSVDWSTVQIFSPVSGTVSIIWEDKVGGMQVRIKSEEYPAFYFIIFHVNLTNPLNVGDLVTAGQQLGTLSHTMSDIAVGVNMPGEWIWKLVSYFDVMTDSVFQNYQARGLSSRTDAIISKEARDADPLTCDGDQFTDSGNLENYVVLN